MSKEPENSHNYTTYNMLKQTFLSREEEKTVSIKYSIMYETLNPHLKDDNMNQCVGIEWFPGVDPGY